MFQTQTWQTWDAYVHFALFRIVPLAVGVIMLISIVTSYVRTLIRRHESGRWEMDDVEMARIFKGIRSTRLVLLLGSVGLVFHAVTCVLYVVVVVRPPLDAQEYLSSNCHLIPFDVRLDYGRNAALVTVYHIMQVR